MKLKLLVLLAALFGFANFTSAQIVWDGNQILGSTTGGFLAAGTVMADTGVMLSGDTGDHKPGDWAVIFKCAGLPVCTSNCGGTGTPVYVGGAGVYTFEKYNAGGVLKLQVLAHPTTNHDDLQSIPPFALAVGEGLRIKTLVPLQGLMSCSIWRYWVVM